MAAHKVPNYHDYRCGQCGRFMQEFGGYIKTVGFFDLYPIEVCTNCNSLPDIEY